jgi:hypothetical protein
MFRCLRASAALLRNRLAPLDPTIPLRFMVPPLTVPRVARVPGGDSGSHEEAGGEED